MKLPTMDDVDIDGKTVLARVDINSPLDPETMEILDISRIKRIVPTVKELRDKKSKVVILAHQGRPGGWDFTGLEKHAAALSNEIGDEVRYVNDIYGKRARNAIKELKEGEVLMLDNVRKFDGEQEKKMPEDHSQSIMVHSLAPLADIFVNDAFAAAHRSQCSLVGFIPAMPSCAGRLMEKEIKTLAKIMERPERPSLFIFGGAKYSNAIKVINNLLERKVADKILLGGVPGSVFLKMKKASASETEEISKILHTFRDKIVLPVDVAIDDGGRKELLVSEMHELQPYDIQDIGGATIKAFTEGIDGASTVLISGPMGVFEKKEFEKGTRKVLEAIAASKSFSVIGGGHTVAAACKFGLADKISYVSTGGGSLEQFLMGGKLPVIDALERYRGRKC
ncbi:MAG: phosphoglycerate kinase [Candidatus Thermoplasmatota archaeon]|nr:phosphoglycerate kinase [Candidatus Thermoplasmatota archaeon]